MSHNIEKIYYINLDRRTDRREEIENELTSFGLCAERFSAIAHEEGIVGCGKSHLEVFKIAKKNGYKNVLILEDDFSFLVTTEEFETLIGKFFIHIGNNYNVCMLSSSFEQCESDKPYPFLGKVIEASNASAYLVNGDYLDELIALYEYALPLLEKTGQHWNYANDQIWKLLQKRDIWYAFLPKLGRQRPGYSDNTKGYTDYAV